MSDPNAISVAVPQRGTATRPSFQVGIVTLTTVASGLFLAYVARQTAGAQGLAFSDAGMANIAQVMSPLILLALFVERACEVVISAWRDHDAQVLQHKVEVAEPGSAPFAQQALDRYRLHTQKLAFIVTCTLALFGALVGVRAIEPLLADAVLGGITREQLLWFHRFDVVVTALLVGGGADGMHKIVTMFTDFLDSTRQRLNTPAPGGAPQG